MKNIVAFLLIVFSAAAVVFGAFLPFMKARLFIAAIQTPFGSIEQFEKCVKLADELIPTDLKEYITIEHHEAYARQYDEVPYKWFSAYKDLPLKHWDFILVDGPGPWFLQK